ncbi:MAG: phosphatidate cytidylyltransferase [Kiritimatiellae bacterium]|jgi:phosphatidate cytidylyltransferase|nr:phosphatidate cytidylyltransferase [Kiritimatiellia bacterium]
MLIRRICAGLAVATFWILTMCYLPSIVIFAVLLAMSVACQREFYGMMKQRGAEVEDHLGVAAGLIWLALVYIYPPEVLKTMKWGGELGALTIGLFVFLLLARVMFNSKVKNPVERVGVTLLGFFYLPFMLSYFIRVAQWGALKSCEIPACRTGIFLAAFVAVVVKLGDVGAFGVGISCGKHKMCPSISPKKSWEGLAGGMIASVLASIAMAAVARRYECISGGVLESVSMLTVAALGLVLGLTGVIGDLFESMFKRSAEIKDSAGLLPGMGGILDMFDSLIFTPAVMYWFLIWTS